MIEYEDGGVDDYRGEQSFKVNSRERDDPPGNVVPLRVAPMPESRATESVERVLAAAQEQARAGGMPFVLVVASDGAGGVRLLFSQPCDEVRALGMLEVAKVSLISRLARTIGPK